MVSKVVNRAGRAKGSGWCFKETNTLYTYNGTPQSVKTVRAGATVGAGATREVRVYRTTQRILDIIDYARVIIDIAGALAQPTPQAAAAAVVSKLQSRFGVDDLSGIVSGFNAAIQSIANDWDDIANAIGAKAQQIAAEASTEGLRRLGSYLKAQAEGRLKLVFFAPSGPFAKRRDTYIDVGDNVQIGVSPGGGRLFGFGIRTSKGNVDQVFRIDYWDGRPNRPTPTPLHVHYHVYDIINHASIWP